MCIQKVTKCKSESLQYMQEGDVYKESNQTTNIWNGLMPFGEPSAPYEFIYDKSGAPIMPDYSKL